MQIIESITEMQRVSASLRQIETRIGVVPTMGYLHEGHLSLIRRAREVCDCVVATLFVNPTQFAPGEDFERYPRDLERDVRLCKDAGVDILFSPKTGDVYPLGYATSVSVDGVSSILEGNIRPEHFRGVTTIVAKLFNIVNPHVAVFGQKDAQQAFIIEKMVKDLNMDIVIEVAPIVREPDGLAMSSRNVYLSSDERKAATALYRSLKYAEERVRAGEASLERIHTGIENILLAATPSKIDYIAFIDPMTFRETTHLIKPNMLIALAVRFGATRLIDNILINT
jgi:pantoate--beta-alanine ligase